MARSAAYRWQNERKRGLIGSRPKKRKAKPQGITNKQARYLGVLQRQLREAYSGNGMTKADACRAITDAKRRLKDATPAGARATRTSAKNERNGKPIG